MVLSHKYNISKDWLEPQKIASGDFNSNVRHMQESHFIIII